jgi:hypothetical protein
MRDIRGMMLQLSERFHCDSGTKATSRLSLHGLQD